MKNKRITVLTVLLSVVFLSAQVHAVSHSNKTIAKLLPPDSRTFVFFTLNDVSSADASSAPSAGPWFAIPKTHPNYKDMYAALLGAKLTGAPVRVDTSGDLACEKYADIELIMLE